ncbi:uncharacterized protein LOC121390498 [Gigantopelta aegis]|uniref:uncharacterized protein LOC121390498 n=1 Tax=Gigantopelta aegis TaxID=1735272 RepID=UPI001B88B297|nr:uncharacterized protein LOC121390498 [Gigantopelta aegis]
MAKITMSLAVTAMAMFFLDIHAYRTPIKLVEPLRPILLEAVRPVVILSKPNNQEIGSAKLLLILLHTACQKLKDQRVTPLPDYCYINTKYTVKTSIRPSYP